MLNNHIDKTLEKLERDIAKDILTIRYLNQDRKTSGFLGVAKMYLPVLLFAYLGFSFVEGTLSFMEWTTDAKFLWAFHSVFYILLRIDILTANYKFGKQYTLLYQFWNKAFVFFTALTGKKNFPRKVSTLLSSSVLIVWQAIFCCLILYIVAGSYELFSPMSFDFFKPQSTSSVIEITQTHVRVFQAILVFLYLYFQLTMYLDIDTSHIPIEEIRRIKKEYVEELQLNTGQKL